MRQLRSRVPRDIGPWIISAMTPRLREAQERGVDLLSSARQIVARNTPQRLSLVVNPAVPTTADTAVTHPPGANGTGHRASATSPAFASFISSAGSANASGIGARNSIDIESKSGLASSARVAAPGASHISQHSALSTAMAPAGSRLDGGGVMPQWTGAPLIGSTAAARAASTGLGVTGLASLDSEHSDGVQGYRTIKPAFVRPAPPLALAPEVDEDLIWLHDSYVPPFLWDIGM